MNIAIIDDHSIVIEGYMRLLNSTEYNVIFYATNITDATRLLQSHHPDCVILDLSLPDGTGINMAKTIKTYYPACKIVVVSMHCQEPYISKALTQGVNAYLSKNNVANDLFAAFEAINEGRLFIGKDIQRHQVNSSISEIIHNLTDREQETFKYLAMGHSIKKVAAILDIMPKTVHCHKANLFNKLNIRDYPELLRLAIQYQIIDASDLLESP